MYDPVYMDLLRFLIMLEFVEIEIKDGPRILHENDKLFQLVKSVFEEEISKLNENKITCDFILDVKNDKLRLGLDVISAEDILITNVALNTRTAIINLFTKTTKHLLTKKTANMVVDKGNV